MQKLNQSVGFAQSSSAFVTRVAFTLSPPCVPPVDDASHAQVH